MQKACPDTLYFQLKVCLRIVALPCILICSGCAKDLVGDLYILDNYGDIVPQKLRFEGVAFVILDRPGDGRMIAATLGQWRGVTAEYVEQATGAARRYLEQSGRACTINSTRLASATDGSIELFYSCTQQGAENVL